MKSFFRTIKTFIVTLRTIFCVSLIKYLAQERKYNDYIKLLCKSLVTTQKKCRIETYFLILKEVRNPPI